MKNTEIDALIDLILTKKSAEGLSIWRDPVDHPRYRLALKSWVRRSRNECLSQAEIDGLQELAKDL